MSGIALGEVVVDGNGIGREFISASCDGYMGVGFRGTMVHVGLQDGLINTTTVRREVSWIGIETDSEETALATVEEDTTAIGALTNLIKALG